MSPKKWTKLGKRNKSRLQDRGCYVPTPQQIAEGTARIRRGWKKATAISRAVGGEPIPVETELYQDPAQLFRPNYQALHIYR